MTKLLTIDETGRGAEVSSLFHQSYVKRWFDETGGMDVIGSSATYLPLSLFSQYIMESNISPPNSTHGGGEKPLTKVSDETPLTLSARFSMNSGPTLCPSKGASCPGEYWSGLDGCCGLQVRATSYPLTTRDQQGRQQADTPLLGCKVGPEVSATCGPYIRQMNGKA